MEEKIEEIKEIEPIQETSGPTRKPSKLPALIVGAILVLCLTLVFIGVPLFRVYQDGRKAYALGKQVQETVKGQDIKKTSEALRATKNEIIQIQQDLKPILWAKFIPFLGGYISDLSHFISASQYGLEAGEIMAAAVEPYADLLGLKSQGAPAGGTTEDRVAKMIETLDKVTPQLDQIAQKMELIKKEITPVDPNRYPEKFSGKPIRSSIAEVKDIIFLADNLFREARPMVKKFPDLLGNKSEVKYLVLFQNDKELRPTGGFITAYAVFRVEKGRIRLDAADDIYKLDDTVTKHVTPPDPIARYLNVYGWRLRDANFSPDFSSSMRTFEEIYANSTAKKNVVGIIAVDTQFLVSLMDALGPINIYGTNFTTSKVPQCDCPMVVYELLKQAGAPRNYWTDNRKDMIGILLQAVMKKALDAPSEANPKIFQAALTQAQQKHMLVYFHDPDVQKGVEALGLAGRVKVSDNDYLHISDANLGGAKSNLYVRENVTQEISVTDTGANINLTLDYRYSRNADNCSLERKEGLCLAGIYRDYLRVYLPKGAIVEEAKGFENKSRTFEDLDHAVVDGYFTVVPQGLAKIQIKYKVPGSFKKTGEYRSLIQKQPGTDAIHYKITINGKLQEFDLLEDKEISAKL